MNDIKREQDPFYIKIPGDNPKPKTGIDIDEIQEAAALKTRKDANLERLRRGFKSVVAPFSMGFHVKVNEVLAARKMSPVRRFFDIPILALPSVHWSYTPEEGYFSPNRRYHYQAEYERTKNGILLHFLNIKVNDRIIDLNFSDGEINSVFMDNPEVNLLESTPTGAELGGDFIDKIGSQSVKAQPGLTGFGFAREHFHNPPDLTGYKYLPDKDEFSLKEPRLITSRKPDILKTEQYFQLLKSVLELSSGQRAV